MQIRIDPDAPGVFGALLDTENKKTITGMFQIMRESLVTDSGEKVPPVQADIYLKAMSYNEMNRMGDKFQKAMEGLKSQALPPIGSGL
jgi:hypothetical protein